MRKSYGWRTRYERGMAFGVVHTCCLGLQSLSLGKNCPFWGSQAIQGNSGCIIRIPLGSGRHRIPKFPQDRVCELDVQILQGQ